MKHELYIKIKDYSVTLYDAVVASKFMNEYKGQVLEQIAQAQDLLKDEIARISPLFLQKTPEEIYNEIASETSLKEVMRIENTELRALTVNTVGFETFIENGLLEKVNSETIKRTTKFYDPVTDTETEVEYDDTYELYELKLSDNLSLKVIKCKDTSTDRVFYMTSDYHGADPIEAIARTYTLPVVSGEDAYRSDYISKTFDLVVRHGDLLLGRLKEEPKGGVDEDIPYSASLGRTEYLELVELQA